MRTARPTGQLACSWTSMQVNGLRRDTDTATERTCAQSAAPASLPKSDIARPGFFVSKTPTMRPLLTFACPELGRLYVTVIWSKRISADGGFPVKWFTQQGAVQSAG